MRALVVGGSKGIGRAIVELLEKDGHQVHSLSRTENGFDLCANEGEIQARVSCLDPEWLILSGGMGAYTGPWWVPRELRYEMWQTNVAGPIECYMASKRALMRNRGKVLFVGSSVGALGAKALADYAATKSAIEGYVRCEARGMAKHHVAMNVLQVGWVETPMTDDIKPEIRAAINRSIPARRMAFPEEVADVAVRVLGMPHWTTGQIIPMTGGA